MKLILWDLGGQAELRTIWDKYYGEAHGVMFVVDSADTERFAEAKSELGKWAMCIIAFRLTTVHRYGA